MLIEVKIEEVKPGDVVVIETSRFVHFLFSGSVYSNDTGKIEIEEFDGSTARFYHKEITHIYKQVEG